jgi:spore photoproduct lyase
MSTSKNNTAFLRHGENRGRFIKPCPGTPRYVCCGYRIINIAHGCTLNCSYCILEDYFEADTPILFSNIDKLADELEQVIQSSSGILRFGTGEFTDSLLSLDYYKVYEQIFPIIARSPNAILELKTKTTNIEPLLEMGFQNRIILSWSLNSVDVASQIERDAPGIDMRIDAAKSVAASGFKLGFHFDPIVFYEGWEQGYRETIEMLFERVDPKHIVYISMGSLRFSPHVQESIVKRSRLFLQGDYIRGIDGKIRYFRPQRTKLYRTVLGYLRRHIADDSVYLCMENQDVWKDVFGMENMTSSNLSRRLDNVCRAAFKDIAIS